MKGRHWYRAVGRRGDDYKRSSDLRTALWDDSCYRLKSCDNFGVFFDEFQNSEMKRRSVWKSRSRRAVAFIRGQEVGGFKVTPTNHGSHAPRPPPTTPASLAFLYAPLLQAPLYGRLGVRQDQCASFSSVSGQDQQVGRVTYTGIYLKGQGKSP